MPVKEIQSLSQFREQVLDSDKVIFADFWAEWCGPCRMISPAFEKLAEAHAENDAVDFYKVNIDHVDDVAQEVAIKSLPTFQVYKDGQKVSELVGANVSRLENLISTHVAR